MHITVNVSNSLKLEKYKFTENKVYNSDQYKGKHRRQMFRNPVIELDRN